MKKIGFLSFGHWGDSYGSQVRSASDALLQSIDLAVAAEALGADGAYFRVHHFARQLGSPFPLLAAVGARTRTIEIGTAVIDMRYENPLYMAEDAGATSTTRTSVTHAITIHLLANGALTRAYTSPRGSPLRVPRKDIVAVVDDRMALVTGRLGKPARADCEIPNVRGVSTQDDREAAAL